MKNTKKQYTKDSAIFFRRYMRIYKSRWCKKNSSCTKRENKNQ